VNELADRIPPNEDVDESQDKDGAAMSVQDDEDKLFGQIAIQKGFIDSMNIAEALSRQLSDMAGRPIGVVLLALGLITQEQIAEILDEQERQQSE